MVTYLVRQAIMFDYAGTLMFLCSLDSNNSVLVFEAGNGHYVHEFTFHNNILPLLKHEIKQELREEDQLKEEAKKQQGAHAASLKQMQPPVGNGDLSQVCSSPSAVSDTANASANANQLAEAQKDEMRDAQRRKWLKEKGFFDCRIPKEIKVSVQHSQNHHRAGHGRGKASGHRSTSQHIGSEGSHEDQVHGHSEDSGSRSHSSAEDERSVKVGGAAVESQGRSDDVVLKVSCSDADGGQVASKQDTERHEGVLGRDGSIVLGRSIKEEKDESEKSGRATRECKDDFQSFVNEKIPANLKKNSSMISRSGEYTRDRLGSNYGQMSALMQQEYLNNQIEGKLAFTRSVHGIDQSFWDQIENIDRSYGRPRVQNKTKLNKTFTNFCWNRRLSKSPYRIDTVLSGVALNAPKQSEELETGGPPDLGKSQSPLIQDQTSDQAGRHPQGRRTCGCPPGPAASTL